MHTADEHVNHFTITKQKESECLRGEKVMQWRQDGGQSGGRGADTPYQEEELESNLNQTPSHSNTINYARGLQKGHGSEIKS